MLATAEQDPNVGMALGRLSITLSDLACVPSYGFIN